jgi:shikimate kinase
MVHEGSLCIYLRTSVDQLVSRLSSETSGRPLLKTGADTSNTALRTRILDLMSRRASTYERVAHQIIDTDGKSIDQIAAEIRSLL